MSSWNFKHCIKSQIPLFLLFIITSVLLGSFLYLATLNKDIVILEILILALLFLVYGIFDVVRRYRFYKRLPENLQMDWTDHTPSFEEGKFIQQYLERQLRMYEQQISKERTRTLDYKEYIELWIHEVKTPIAASYLLLESEKGERSASLKHQIQQVDQYVEQALYYAKVSQMEKDLVLQKVKLIEIIQSVLKFYKTSLLLKRIQLKVDTYDGVILSDTKWLTYVISQLIGNALKYIEDGGVIEIQILEQEQNVVMYIRDDGCGILASDLPRVFDKGFTGKNGRNKHSKSTGFGLYLVKQMCEGMNHNIRITSDHGTCVQLVFPKDESLDFLTKL